MERTANSSITLVSCGILKEKNSNVNAKIFTSSLIYPRIFLKKFWFKTDYIARLATNFCNPSYSGGRDMEDHSSKPAQERSLQIPMATKT
jgi:hypothetical protein